MAHRLLLSTGDEELRAALPGTLRARGALCLLPVTPGALMQELQRYACDLLVIDRRHLGSDPAATMAEARDLPDAPEVVVLLAKDETLGRAQLLAGGAFAVLSRETPVLELSEALTALARRAATARREAALAGSGADEATLDSAPTKSARMGAFLDVVRRVAPSDSSLLIQGETGAGKEHLARMIHRSSARRAGPFVPVHCAALSEPLLESELFGHVQGAFTGATRYRRGYFELGHEGTVFLDEVGELSPSLQVKLLRVLQDRRVQPVGSEEGLDIDLRLIAATNRTLPAEIEAGRFRMDLYYRLSVVTLQLPPLRERAEDIDDLVRHLVQRSSEARRRGVREVSPEALEALRAYPWPGNVRELMNVLERAALLARGAVIQPADLPFSAPSGSTHAGGGGAPESTLAALPFAAARDQALASFETSYLHGILTRERGHLASAALRARMNPRSLYEKMKRHGLRKEDYR